MISRKETNPTLDIIIPIYNEEEMIAPLLAKIAAVFSSSELKSRKIKSVRTIFIDDGSTDKSAEKIADEIFRGFPAELHRLSRNFGHQNAVSAGFNKTTADLVVVMDADLQDPPEIIYEMIERWRDGYDVIYGERRKRKENILKVICYWFFYRMLAFLSEISVPLDSGEFSLVDQRVVKAMLQLPEKLRFPRGLRSWVGFKQI